MSESRERTRESTIGRRYILEFLPGIAGFVLLFLGVPALVDLKSGNWWDVPLALLPILPVLWMGIAFSRHVRRVDDYQRRLIMLGLALAFAATMLTSIVIMLLPTAGVAVAGAEWWVFAVGMAVWFGSSIWATTR